ncbi:hypothetical protein PTW32_10935 [Dechloromonas agitata]|uniref:hypothetical protein n=1 Tax=Dechloromonas agitata TaxID=73030 RepID=UPI00237E4FE6|nr:hypothetical protein [Dechloromonas agitata]MDE1545935.1 hypothetical protein [Dechloromonas agitata]
MATMQDVVDLARIDLNDNDKTRIDDSALLSSANAAIREAYQVRPDLRLGSYATPVADKAIGDTFPLGDDYKRLVADFIIGRSFAIDSEVADLNRVPAYLQIFRDQLLGV